MEASISSFDALCWRTLRYGQLLLHAVGQVVREAEEEVEEADEGGGEGGEGGEGEEGEKAKEKRERKEKEKEEAADENVYLRKKEEEQEVVFEFHS